MLSLDVEQGFPKNLNCNIVSLGNVTGDCISVGPNTMNYYSKQVELHLPNSVCLVTLEVEMGHLVIALVHAVNNH